MMCGIANMNRVEFRRTVRLFKRLLRQTQRGSPMFVSPCKLEDGRGQQDSWDSLLRRTFNEIPGFDFGVYRPADSLQRRRRGHVK